MIGLNDHTSSAHDLSPILQILWLSLFMLAFHSCTPTSRYQGSLPSTSRDTLLWTSIASDTAILVFRESGNIIYLGIAQWTRASDGLVLRSDTLCEDVHQPDSSEMLPPKMISIGPDRWLFWSCGPDEGTSGNLSQTLGLTRIHDGVTVSAEYSREPNGLIFDRTLTPLSDYNLYPHLWDSLQALAWPLLKSDRPGPGEEAIRDFLSRNPALTDMNLPRPAKGLPLIWVEVKTDLVNAFGSSVTSEVQTRNHLRFVSLFKGPVLGVDPQTGKQWIAWVPRSQLDWVEDLVVSGDTLIGHNGTLKILISKQVLLP